MVKRQMQPTRPWRDGQAKYLHTGISLSPNKSEVLIPAKYEQPFEQSKWKKPVSEEHVLQFL